MDAGRTIGQLTSYIFLESLWEDLTNRAVDLGTCLSVTFNYEKDIKLPLVDSKFEHLEDPSGKSDTI